MRDNFKEGMEYQSFIVNARKCFDDNKHGANRRMMQNLMDAENGRKVHLFSHNKLL